MSYVTFRHYGVDWAIIKSLDQTQTYNVERFQLDVSPVQLDTALRGDNTSAWIECQWAQRYFPSVTYVTAVHYR